MSVRPAPRLPPSISRAFDAMPLAARHTLLAVRELIYTTADNLDGIGQLRESLKWNRPSYVPARPRIGSPVRLGLSRDGEPALLCHCQTSLIGDFQARYPKTFEYEGNRALLLPVGRALPEEPLAHCIAMALTYHRA